MPATSYTRTARILHWLMAAIIITAWIIGFYSANFLSYADPGSNKAAIITLHKQIATTVLFLVTLRILWRLGHRPPPLPGSMSPFMQVAAHAGHLLLYLLMLAVPASGVLYSNAAGYPAPVAWLFELPVLLSPRDEAAVADFGKVHIYLAWFLGVVVAGHALMALKHQFIDKDGTLSRML